MFEGPTTGYLGANDPSALIGEGAVAIAQVSQLQGQIDAKASLTQTTAALATKADAAQTAAALATKADAAQTTAALATKADAAQTTAALATKADAAQTTAALATKADAAQTTAALATKQAAIGEGSLGQSAIAGLVSDLASKRHLTDDPRGAAGRSGKHAGTAECDRD